MMMMVMMMMKHSWPGNSHVEEEDHLQTGSSIKGFSGQIPQNLAVGRQETRKIMDGGLDVAENCDRVMNRQHGQTHTHRINNVDSLR